jgi:hypothetical protein
MNTKFYLLAFILIFFSSCKEKWEYEFIREFMTNPERSLDYARKNEIILNKTLKDKLNKKLTDIAFIEYLKGFSKQGFEPTVDKVELFYKNADTLYKEETHRITISNKSKTECINFYFGNSSELHKISGIFFSNSSIEPQGIDSRTECGEELY